MFDKIKEVVYNRVKSISIADILIVTGTLKAIYTVIELNYYLGNILLGLAMVGLGLVLSLGGE